MEWLKTEIWQIGLLVALIMIKGLTFLNLALFGLLPGQEDSDKEAQEKVSMLPIASPLILILSSI